MENKKKKMGGVIVAIGLLAFAILFVFAASGSDGEKTYIFVPGNQGVLHGATSNATLKHWGGGDVTIYSTKDGYKEIVFPVTLPAVLDGERMRVEEIAFSYIATGDHTRLSRVQLYRTKTNGKYRTIVDVDWKRSRRIYKKPSAVKEVSWLERTFPVTRDNLLSYDDGQLAVRVKCFIPAGSKVQFTGVRVQLGHD